MVTGIGEFSDAAYGMKKTSQSKGQQNGPLKEQSEWIQVVIEFKSTAGRCAKEWAFASCTFEDLSAVWMKASYCQTPGHEHFLNTQVC